MRKILPLIFAAALTLPVKAATTNFDLPISFDLTTAACSRIPSDIHGVGSIHFVISVNQDGKGVWHTTVLGVAHGTATDVSGTQYRFNYSNHFSFTGSTNDGNPPNPIGSNAQPPFNLIDTDSFTLEAQGNGGPHIKVHFVTKLIVNTNGTATLDFFKVSGELGCDAI